MSAAIACMWKGKIPPPNQPDRSVGMVETQLQDVRRTERINDSNHSPLEGESQRPSRQATADVGGGAGSLCPPALAIRAGESNPHQTHHSPPGGGVTEAEPAGDG